MAKDNCSVGTGSASFLVSLFLYWDRVFLCSSGCLGTHLRYLDGLKLTEIFLPLHNGTGTKGVYQPCLPEAFLYQGHDNIVYRTLILAYSLEVCSFSWHFVCFFVCLMYFHYWFFKWFFKIICLSRWWWYKPLHPALGRQRQADIWCWGHPGLPSKFQDKPLLWHHEGSLLTGVQQLCWCHICRHIHRSGSDKGSGHSWNI